MAIKARGMSRTSKIDEIFPQEKAGSRGMAVMAFMIYGWVEFLMWKDSGLRETFSEVSAKMPFIVLMRIFAPNPLKNFALFCPN